MPTDKFDNRHFTVGTWVAVDGFIGEEKETPWGTKIPEPEYDGTPLKILAVSMPFISVSNGENTFGLDTRQWSLRLLDRKYVREMTRDLKATSKHEIRRMNLDRIEKTKKSTKKRKHDPRDCPRCETRLVQRLIDRGMWIWICPECGFEGEGPSEKGAKK